MEKKPGVVHDIHPHVLQETGEYPAEATGMKEHFSQELVNNICDTTEELLDDIVGEHSNIGPIVALYGTHLMRTDQGIKRQSLFTFLALPRLRRKDSGEEVDVREIRHNETIELTKSAIRASMAICQDKITLFLQLMVEMLQELGLPEDRIRRKLERIAEVITEIPADILDKEPIIEA